MLCCVIFRGLQDELFNLTLDQLRVTAERTRAEARLNGSIQRVQLDNQMLVSVPTCALHHAAGQSLQVAQKEQVPAEGHVLTVIQCESRRVV